MRHEWLTTPMKGKHLKRRKRARVGLEQAMARKRGTAPAGEDGSSEPSGS